MSLIIEMLKESCHRQGDKIALRRKAAGQWTGLSYTQLWEESDRVASGLAACGIEPGDRVALLGPSSPEWVVAYFGALKNNAIAVPIDKELKQGELRHILTDCGARVLFTEQGFVEIISDIIENLPNLEKIILLNHQETTSKGLTPQAEKALAEIIYDWQRLSDKYAISEEDAKSFESLAENFQKLVLPESTKPADKKKSFFSKFLQKDSYSPQGFDIEPMSSFKASEPAPALQTDPHDPAVILYTSGTTGRSKGAMLSHANISSNVRTAAELFQLDPSMHTLSFLPINHVFEQVAGIILPLYVGGTVSFAESIKKLGDNLREVKPNFLLGVPAVFRLLADRMTKRIEGNKISRMLFSLPPTRKMVTNKVREAFGGNPVFISGGAALDPVVAKTLLDLGLNVYQGYGVTETSPVIAVETPQHNRIGTVGLPLKDVEIKIHEPNADGTGEIWVKGPNVMLGYYNNQDATNEVITDGWYHTGDLGHIAEDGYLSICGRVKNLIVTANGKNVYPEEVENELSNSPFIAEVMVYGHKVDHISEEVHAMIYPNQDALDNYAAETGEGSLDIAQVEELIRREVLERGKQLADYKRVKRFTLRDEEFPKTTTRKIKRFVVEADITTEK